MVEKFEVVGTLNETIRIWRQFDPASGFQYFLEENGELRSFDAFGEREYGFRMPYPVMLDRLIDRGSMDWEVCEIGGRELRLWYEKALQYYEKGGELGCWKEYWGLLKKEREMLFFALEHLFRREENIWRKLLLFRRRVLNESLGKYRNKLIDHFIEKMVYVLENHKLEKPRNKAKGLLMWLDEHEAKSWGWSLESIMDIPLNGLYEWDYLTAEETEQMADAIYERLQELAEEEEDWAGLSLEEWLDLLKKKLVEKEVIKDTDAAFWKWIKRYLERRDQDLYDLLNWALEENVDWYWMPRKEKKELASALEEFIIEKLEEMSESTA